jgi:hypothetical protein
MARFTLFQFKWNSGLRFASSGYVLIDLAQGKARPADRRGPQVRRTESA